MCSTTAVAVTIADRKVSRSGSSLLETMARLPRIVAPGVAHSDRLFPGEGDSGSRALESAGARRQVPTLRIVSLGPIEKLNLQSYLAH
jgi:hypothetical protein